MRAKFRLKVELPKIIEKYKTLAPADLSKFILQDCNKDVAANTITKFLGRHAEMRDEYARVFSGDAIAQIEVSGDLFMNGNFRETQSVKQWILEKKTLLSPAYLEMNINALKRICQGIYFSRYRDSKTKKRITFQIPNWEPKHPDRITLEQFKIYEGAVMSSGNATNVLRIAFRDFWLSRTGKTLKPSEVSGIATTGTTHELGRWKNVDVDKELLYLILAKLKERDFQWYAAVFTAYKTGSRHTAVLTQYLKSKVYLSEGYPTIEVTDKGFHRTGRLPFPKMLSPDLYTVLEQCWTRYGNNPFEGITDESMMKALKTIYREVLKDDLNPDGTPKPYSALELALSSPFHFWRHMFGRKMLEATNYNYNIVAFLGNWKDEAMLHKVYGAPPMKMLNKAGFNFLPQI